MNKNILIAILLLTNLSTIAIASELWNIYVKEVDKVSFVSDAYWEASLELKTYKWKHGINIDDSLDKY